MDKTIDISLDIQQIQMLIQIVEAGTYKGKDAPVIAQLLSTLNQSLNKNYITERLRK